MKTKVVVVGAGLAGCEASYWLAQRGIEVLLYECKEFLPTPAQKMKSYAELVCTNSLKSLSLDTPHGLLKWEMEQLGSLVLQVAHQVAVGAGDALAVDRQLFSQKMTFIVKEHPLITVIEEEVKNPLLLLERSDVADVIVATGPLTQKSLEDWIVEHLCDGDDYYFYDAIAPIVEADSLNSEHFYWKNRYQDYSAENEKADYWNIPLNQEQYDQLMLAMQEGEKVPAKDFEELKYFESCLPIDTMAVRGKDTARFSCMKPVGLEKPDGTLPYAVIQLRKENLLGDAFNLVGFQTRLTYKEQQRIFRLIPGFEEAKFFHYGSVHRNSFLKASALLNADMSSKKYPHLYFAGQMTGVEGYTESAMSGLYVAWNLVRKREGKAFQAWPVQTAMGSLIHYLMTMSTPRPMNVNRGLLPPPPSSLIRDWKRDRKYRNGETVLTLKEKKGQWWTREAQTGWNSFFIS
jgi:methylenetetrahydrofolate--tRNA-(uracil-5-)-methyltransferase